MSSDRRHRVSPPQSRVESSRVDRTLLAIDGPRRCSLDLSDRVIYCPQAPPPHPPGSSTFPSPSLSHLSVIASPSDSKSRKSTGGQEIRHCCFASFYKESIGKTSLIHKSNLGFEPPSEGESNWVVANNWISCCLVLGEEGRERKKEKNYVREGK